MKKHLFLFLLSFLLLNTSNQVEAQNKPKSKRTGTIYKKDGTIISGNVKNFEGKPSFEKVHPWYLYKRIFNKDLPNYFSMGPQAINKIKIKPNNEKKFVEIPLEEVEGIMFERTFKEGGGEKIYYKTFIGPKFYGKGKKKEKVQKVAVPTLTEGKAINTYGTIYPLRKMIIFFPGVIFETGPPEALGIILIENTEKKLALSLDFIREEKTYSKAKAERREKSDKNKNHNTLNELFGDCPETKPLIDKYYINRIEDPKERKKAAIAYNEKYKKNVKNFKKIVRKDRKKATADLYFSMYEFDLLEIIRTYEKNCLPIDEFDPRHENYQKEFDLINRIKNDSL